MLVYGEMNALVVIMRCDDHQRNVPDLQAAGGISSCMWRVTCKLGAGIFEILDKDVVFRNVLRRCFFCNAGKESGGQDLSQAAKITIAMITVLVALAAAILGVWRCCGCCKNSSSIHIRNNRGVVQLGSLPQ